METVKTLLENIKKDLEMELWWAEEHNKEPQSIEKISVLKQKITDIDKALLSISITKRHSRAEGLPVDVQIYYLDTLDMYRNIKEYEAGVIGKQKFVNSVRVIKVKYKHIFKKMHEISK